MPKMKTHRATKKRVAKTGGGKLLRLQAYTSHLKEAKSSTRKRRLAGKESIAKADRKRVRKMLGA